MSFSRGVTLLSLWTNKEKHFKSGREATDWLGRSHGYLQSVQKYGGYPTKVINGEEFEIIWDASPRKMTIHKKELGCADGNAEKVLSNSLCNFCARAVGFCIWSQSNANIPVDGWEAERSYDAEGNEYSWAVIDCPLFVGDAATAEERKKQREMLLKEAFENGKEN